MSATVSDAVEASVDGDVADGLDDDDDADLGVEDGHVEPVALLEAAVERGVGVGVHGFDPPPHLERPVRAIRILDVERDTAVGEEVPVLLAGGGVGEPGPFSVHANHMTLL